MKKLIIAILIILVLGLWFFPAPTRNAITITAHSIAEIAKDSVNKIKENEQLMRSYEEIKANISEKIDFEEVKQNGLD